MCKVFYLNGNDIEYNLRIVEGSKLYNFLSDNHYTDFDRNDEEYITISEETLKDLSECDIKFSEEENVLIGYLDFYLDYNRGYIFK